MTKIRWVRTGMESNEIHRYVTKKEEEDEEKIEEAIHLNQRVLDDDSRP